MKRIILLCLVSILSMAKVNANWPVASYLIGEWEVVEYNGEFYYPNPNDTFGVLKNMTLADCGPTYLEFEREIVSCNGFIVTGLGTNLWALHVFTSAKSPADGQLFNMNIEYYDDNKLKLKTYDGYGELLLRRKKNDVSAVEKIEEDVKGDKDKETYNVKGIRLENSDKAHGVIIKKDGEKVYKK